MPDILLSVSQMYDARLYVLREASSLASIHDRDNVLDRAAVHDESGTCSIRGDALDSSYPNYPCTVCEQPFGIGVPIIEDEGRLIAHFSCLVEKHIREQQGRAA